MGQTPAKRHVCKDAPTSRSAATPQRPGTVSVFLRSEVHSVESRRKGATPPEHAPKAVAEGPGIDTGITRQPRRQQRRRRPPGPEQARTLALPSFSATPRIPDHSLSTSQSEREWSGTEDRASRRTGPGGRGRRYSGRTGECIQSMTAFGIGTGREERQGAGDQVSDEPTLTMRRRGTRSGNVPSEAVKTSSSHSPGRRLPSRRRPTARSGRAGPREISVCGGTESAALIAATLRCRVRGRTRLRSHARVPVKPGPAHAESPKSNAKSSEPEADVRGGGGGRRLDGDRSPGRLHQ